MKSSDKTPLNFEEQLMQSAKRLRDKENYELPLRKISHRRFAWGWISTATAAVIGWIVGISFPMNDCLPQNEMAANLKTDTVIQYKEKLVRDTIFQKVEVPVKIRVEVPVLKSQKELQEGTVGCNVECDGIDYALLFGK